MLLKSIGFLTRNRTSVDDSVPALFRKEEDFTAVVRQYFPEVWLFEDYNLGLEFFFLITISVS